MKRTRRLNKTDVEDKIGICFNGKEINGETGVKNKSNEFIFTRFPRVEQIDNQELAKGNGMLEINHSRRNIICICSDSTIYISNRVTKKVNYGANHLPFSSAVSPSLLGQTRIQGWLGAVCSRVGHTLGARCEHLYNARARGKVFCRRTENKL